MAGEIVYADLRHLGGGSSAENHGGKSHFGGGNASFKFWKDFWICLFLGCFFISMLRFLRSWRTLLWVKCLLRWDPGLKRGGERERERKVGRGC